MEATVGSAAAVAPELVVAVGRVDPERREEAVEAAGKVDLVDLEAAEESPVDTRA